MNDQPPRRRTFQIGLRTLILLMTAVAVWTVYFANRHAIRQQEERIAAMRPLARELVVKDESQIAVIKQESYWYDENRWALYLPPGTYRLCLATREIDESGFAPIVKSMPLASGRHTLSLEQAKTDDGWRVAVLGGGQEVLAAEEPKAWYPAVGSVGGAQFDSLDERASGEPVILFRRRFTQPAPGGRSTTPKGPTDGVMLWIERDGRNRDGGNTVTRDSDSD